MTACHTVGIHGKHCDWLPWNRARQGCIPRIFSKVKLNKSILTVKIWQFQFIECCDQTFFRNIKIIWWSLHPNEPPPPRFLGFLSSVSFHLSLYPFLSCIKHVPGQRLLCLFVPVSCLNASLLGPVSAAPTLALPDRPNPRKIRIHFESDG